MGNAPPLRGFGLVLLFCSPFLFGEHMCIVAFHTSKHADSQHHSHHIPRHAPTTAALRLHGRGVRRQVLGAHRAPVLPPAALVLCTCVPGVGTCLTVYHLKDTSNEVVVSTRIYQPNNYASAVHEHCTHNTEHKAVARLQVAVFEVTVFEG